MQAQVDRLSPVLVEVKVEVPWIKVSEQLEQAYKTVQRTAKVRGFRPGKVPRNVVKNLMAKSVEQDVTNKLVESELGAVVDEHKLDAIGMTHLDAAPIGEGQPLKFTAKLEVKPVIDNVDMSGLKVERATEPVSDEQVDAEINRLREQNAELRAPETEREAREGDVLTVDIDVVLDGKPEPEMGSQGTRAELGAGKLLEALEEALRGSRVGDERKATTTFPEDYGHAPLRGKKADFSVRVKTMQEKVLPALDDDFARDLEHESMDAMRKAIRTQLEDLAKRKAEALVREAVVDKLVETNVVPVPPSLVERQTRQMLQEIFRLQQAFGQELPFGDEMFANMRERAERKVRAGLLFGAVAAQQKLEVTDADVEGKIAQLAEQSGKHVAKVRAEHTGERLDSLRMQILENKLLEYLLSQATITDVAAPAKG